MSVRTLEYAVSVSGINPASELFAGSQGDICATKIQFTLDESLGFLVTKENIKYRFDCYDAEGNVFRSDLADLENTTVSCLLPKEVTRCGGRICVYLIITKTIDDKTEMELYSFPARMRLNSLPNGKEFDVEVQESYTTLALIAKESADKAEKDANKAVESAIIAQEVADFFRKDNEFVFLGGNAEGNVSVEIVVDGEISDTSKNPVMNKAVKKYVDSSMKEIEDKLNEEVDEITKQVDNDIKTIDDKISKAVDYIVEQGTYTNDSNMVWTYRKWNSGIAECWGMVEKTIQIEETEKTKWADCLYTKDDAFPSQTYPFKFTISPVVNVTPNTYDNNFWLFTGNNGSEYLTPTYSVVRPDAATVQGKLNYYVIGRWKNEEE